MPSSRREFVTWSMVGAGTLLIAPACRSREGRAPQPLAAGTRPSYLELSASGELERREAALRAGLASCTGCPRACGADRPAGETGVCSSTARLRIASFGPHFGEEAPLVGRHGSGTIFFSNCNLLCCFCQNWEINHRGDGRDRTEGELADMMLALERRGCRNVNLVTPSHVVPQIVAAVRLAAARGLSVPLVYNTGGYDSLETLRQLDGIVDLYLPDFKYQDPELAARYSSGAADYPEVAAAAIREMHRQVGRLRVDEEGNAVRGLMLRHLVLPDNLAGTDRFVRWVADELGPDTYVNLMAQYRPEHRAFDHPELSRRITADEWAQALDWARRAGLTNLAA